MSTALVSGGKDSIYAAYLCDLQGWPIDEIVTIRPADPESRLFHTPNLDLVRLQAEAWGKRYREVVASGSDARAEQAALVEAVSGGAGPVVAGAIESSYQWTRLLRAADVAHRRVYVPLWRKDPARVVREEIAAGLAIRLVHLSAEPLTPELLGATLDAPLLAELERRSRSVRRMHVAGEGGEFETLVVDAPFFRYRLEIDEARREIGSTTARLTVRSAHLVPHGPVIGPGRAS
jgi:diphthine-ammonia ligase